MATAAAVTGLAGLASCSHAVASPAASSQSASAPSTSLRVSAFRGAAVPRSVNCQPRRTPLVCAVAVEDPVVETKEEDDSPSLAESLAPNSYEIQNLLMELCDETEIAELKLKVGSFQLHVTRNVGAKHAATAPVPVALPVSAPPVPSQPMAEAMAAAPAPAPAPARQTRVEEEKPDEGMAYIRAPRVGVLRRGRFYKGKTGRPVVTEGTVVKEGQVIGYVEQLGTQQPVEATVGGEIAQFLVEDGDPVGYGEPIVEVLPSFHGIKKLA